MTVANEFAKARPVYFRAVSTGGPESPGLQGGFEEHSIVGATERQAGPRPISHYPQMMQTEGLTGLGRQAYQNPLHLVEELDQESPDSPIHNYWSLPRSQSPDELDEASIAHAVSHPLASSPPIPTSNTSWHSTSPPSVTVGSSLHAPLHALSHSTTSLSSGISPSIRSVVEDTADHLSPMFLTASSTALPLDKPNPPFQNPSSFSRSPSLASDRSFNSNSLARPSFNYSRPLSRQSRPSFDAKQQVSSSKPEAKLHLDLVYRQDSTESPLTPFTNDAPQTPVSLASDEFYSTFEMRPDSTPTSFVYKKYALGPKTNRESLGISEFINKQFNWDDSTDSQFTLEFPQPLLLSSHPPSPALTNNGSPPSSRKLNGHADPLMSNNGSPRPSNDRRRRLQKLRPTTPGAAATAEARDESIEEHVNKGIELHEAGSLAESTYHFRLAAKAGHPTAMLLYALACRHGWGVKENAAEGVVWLQNAMQAIQSEIAEDADHINNGQQWAAVNRKAHMAQFALGVYELGMSYLNGWGVPQDKSLALRCFEIAGRWGDTDALSQAALCYSEGIGCKRDMRMAARLYREAEAKGVSVAGNSWYAGSEFRYAVASKVIGRLTIFVGFTRKNTLTEKTMSGLVVPAEKTRAKAARNATSPGPGRFSVAINPTLHEASISLSLSAPSHRRQAVRLRFTRSLIYSEISEMLDGGP
jgi:TPR repeat protein